MTTVAVMQPYAFPYIGYLQLLSAADHFVFYDDVAFIKRGWINRNRILLGGREHLFSIPCIGASQNRLIHEIQVDPAAKWRSKLMQTVETAYRKAPFFGDVAPIVEAVLAEPQQSIAALARQSVLGCCAYLGIERQTQRSSDAHAESAGLGRAERLIAITKALGGSRYVNSIGGQELYEKGAFAEQGVSLSFLRPELLPYEQRSAPAFVPGLSILDLMMHLPPDEILAKHLPAYELI